MRENFLLGIDIGSISDKVALIDDNLSVLYTEYKTHSGYPWMTLLSLLNTLKDNIRLEKLTGVAVTGSGREKLSTILGVPCVNEIVAQATFTS